MSLISSKTPLDDGPDAEHTPRDLARFYTRLGEIARKRGDRLEVLGEVAGWPIYLLTPCNLVSGPDLLVAAGFHGDEPAGPMGILSFLEAASVEFAGRVNISFLPLVNPTGLQHGRRTNDWGEDPNRGFCHIGSSGPQPSREGKVLLSHLPRLLSLSRDAFVSLHEDYEAERFYLYSFEIAEAPGPFSQALRDAEARFFAAHPDGELEGGIVNNGVIFNDCDGSFEDFLFHQGIPRTACTETPCLRPMKERIDANAAIITASARIILAIQNHQPR